MPAANNQGDEMTAEVIIHAVVKRFIVRVYPS